MTTTGGWRGGSPAWSPTCIVTKYGYTDKFFRARRRADEPVRRDPVGLLPPLAMTAPQVEVAGILEPAYDVAGDSFDYALNDDILHMAMIDAMGHGLDAATMATVAIGAYRHARRGRRSAWPRSTRSWTRPSPSSSGPTSFVTAQMMRLDIATGELQLGQRRPSPRRC